ncbi:MAG: preprotein translocase subunit YajC [Chitinivibrionales bacterium]
MFRNLSSTAITLLVLTSCVLAQSGGGEAAKGPQMFSILPMIGIMLVIIYFFMIRPEQKKQKEKQNLIENIKKGDKIITIGGIYGTVSKMKKDTVILKVDGNATMEILKSAVSTVRNKQENNGNNEDGTAELEAKKTG